MSGGIARSAYDPNSYESVYVSKENSVATQQQQFNLQSNPNINQNYANANPNYAAKTQVPPQNVQQQRTNTFDISSQNLRSIANRTASSYEQELFTQQQPTQPPFPNQQLQPVKVNQATPVNNFPVANNNAYNVSSFNSSGDSFVGSQQQQRSDGAQSNVQYQQQQQVYTANATLNNPNRAPQPQQQQQNFTSVSNTSNPTFQANSNPVRTANQAYNQNVTQQLPQQQQQQQYTQKSTQQQSFVSSTSNIPQLTTNASSNIPQLNVAPQLTVNNNIPQLTAPQLTQPQQQQQINNKMNFNSYSVQNKFQKG
jgi:hypothetical protein